MNTSTLAQPGFRSRFLLPTWLISPLVYWLWTLFYVSNEWWSDAEYHFGLAVPVLAAILFFRDRAWNCAATQPWPRLGLALILLALPLMTVAEIIRPHAVVFSRASSWLMVFSAMAMTLGFWLRELGTRGLGAVAGPMILICLAIPMPDTLWLAISQHLQIMVTSITTDLLNMLGIAARQQGSVIITSHGSIGINEACSGLRSLQASLVSGTFFGLLLLRDRFHRAVLLLGSVAVVALANIARTTFLSATLQSMGSAGLAQYHDPAGYAVLLVNMVGLSILSTLLVWRELKLPSSGKSGGQLLTLDPPFKIHRLTLLTSLFLLAIHWGFSARTQWSPSGTHFGMGDHPRTVANIQIQDNPTQAYADVLRFDDAQDSILTTPRGTVIGIFNARWKSGKVSNQFVGQHIPAVCYQNAGWENRGPAEFKSITLRGTTYPSIWQSFQNGNENVSVGFLHLVGGKPRLFRVGERGLFSWRTLKWDIHFGKIAPQEVFIITLSHRGRIEDAWNELTSILEKRYPIREMN
jgi:exosortase